MVRGDQRCEWIASGQHGVLSLEQARSCDLSDDAVLRRVSAQRWIRVWPGVYRMAGTPVSWVQQLMAATLWAGDGSAISHATAAALWGMDGFQERGPIELSLERSTRLRSDRLLIHRAQAWKSGERVRIRGIPVTGAARTLCDLATRVPAERLEEALECCLRRDWTSEKALLTRLTQNRGRGRNSTAALRRLLEVRNGSLRPTESLLETRLLNALREAGLPAAVRQFEVWDGSHFVARLDFAYPNERVAIETDGATYHLRRERWERDHARRSKLTALGWRCLVVTWARLHREPAKVAGELRAALSNAQNPAKSAGF